MRTTIGRRDFLKFTGLGAASLAVPGWLARAVAEPTKGEGAKTLVLVMLGGGNDGLNTVVPLADPLYVKARPTLGIAKGELLKLSDDLGLHPSMRKVRDLFDEGKVAVVNNVGYPGADRSHFRSMEIWQTAQTKGAIRDGWLGRCLPKDESGTPHSVAFGAETPLALWADGGGALSMENPASFEIATDQRHPADRANILRAFKEIYAVPREGPAEQARKRGQEVMGMADRIRTIAYKPAAATVYPNTPLAQGLRFVAGAIDDNLGARVYLIGHGGYDTHANQRGAHANLLTTLSEALFSFQRDLEARGRADSVATMTFSEFGRRVVENQSQGTDHGAAAPLFLMGSGVKGGLFGGTPNLEKLDQGDVAMAVDFRSVYATILERWLAIPSAPVLGGAFELLGAM